MKLDDTTKYSYAFAASGYYVTLALYTIYPIVFMTNCLHISAAAAAMVVTIAEILDFAISLSLGSMIENSRLPWGTYRSWLYIAPLAAGASCVTFFSGFLTRIPQAAVIPAAILLYLVWNLAGTVVMICHGTLNTLLTNHPRGRVELNKLANQFRAAFGALFGSLMMPIMFIVGKSKDVNIQGMTVVSMIYSLFYIVSFFYFAAHLKKLRLNENVKSVRVPVLETVKLILKNGRLAALTLAATLSASGEIIYSFLTSYFFLYVLGKTEILGTFNWASRIFLLLGSSVAFILTRRFSKKQVFVMSSLLQAAMYLALYYAARAPYLALLAICVGIMGQGVSSCMVIPLYSDIADSLNTGGKRVTGAVMAANSLIYKVAGFVGALGTFLLTKVGYVAGTQPDAQVVQGILRITTLNPFLFALSGAAVLLLFYRSKPNLPR